MNFLSDFLKGVLIGVGNIAPGVSGGVLAMILGMYEDLVYAVGNFFKDIRKNIIYLFPISLGSVIGVVGFSNILKHLLKNYTMPTTYAFVGLIAGTVPMLFRKANKRGFRKINIIAFLLTMAVSISFTFVESGFGTGPMATHIDINSVNILKLVLYGFLIAGSIVIPGVSGSILLMMLGAYRIVLEAIASIDIIILAPLAVGVSIGVLAFSKFMEHLLDRYYSITYYAIIGFVIGAIPKVMTGFALDWTGFISTICLIAGLLVSLNLAKIEGE